MLEEPMEEKLLGEGGFGCVFQPEIPCARTHKKLVQLSKKKSRGPSVSKVFTLMDSDVISTEYKFAKLVHTWDPVGEYFVVPTKLCNTTPRLVLEHREAKKCSQLQDVIEEPFLPQIVMPNYGVDMVSFLESYRLRYKKAFSLRTWIKLLENVFQGLKIMHQNGYTHMDIKAENVLYDGKKLRLVDFSLSVPQRTLYKNALQEFSVAYFVYPLEMYLVYYQHVHQCKKESGCNIYYEFMSGLYSFGKENALQYLQYHPYNEIIHKIFVLNTWISQNPTWYEEVKQNVEKIDVYSLGMLCIDVEHFGFDYSTISRDAQVRYKTFIQKMTAIDFRERPTLKEAYELYKQIL